MFEVNGFWVSFISSLMFLIFIYNGSQDNLATLAWGFAFLLFTLTAHASRGCCVWRVFFKISSTYGKFHEKFKTQKVGREIYLLMYFKS